MGTLALIHPQGKDRPHWAGSGPRSPTSVWPKSCRNVVEALLDQTASWITSAVKAASGSSTRTCEESLSLQLLPKEAQNLIEAEM